MEKIHQFDPRSGYVALPSALMDLDLAPGPFRLLIELCRMANKAGECWPSLGQLSERIGRSKAAISGYLEALRDAALVETQTQRMANGYNYRLKYRVVFWGKWRTQLSPAKHQDTSDQKNERTVQPVERRVNSKNQNHKNHTPRGRLEKTRTRHVESVFSIWNDLVKGAPFPTFNAPVSEALVRQTKSVIDEFKAPTMDVAEARSSLENIWCRLGVTVTDAQIFKQAALVSERGFSPREMMALHAEIIQTWKPHWRKAPTDQQFCDMLGRVVEKNPSSQQIRALQQFLRRAAFAEKQLQRRETSSILQQWRAA